MAAELAVLSGSRAGERFPLAGPSVTVGRHPTSALRFDPGADRAVSAEHAVLLLRDGVWHVRDLDSRNGTWVNGHRVTVETALHPGDHVAFGADGPTVELRVDGRGAGGRERTTTAERLRLELKRRTGRTRDVALALGLALVGILGAALYVGDRQRDAWDRERLDLQLRMDSVRQAGALTADSLALQLTSLTESLRRSRESVGALRRALARADAAGDAGERSRLQLQLDRASESLQRRRSAAALDFSALQRRTRHAVAKIYVEYEDGSVVTGSAFAVRPDATLLTSRHVVAGDDGRRTARRVAIQFSDSKQIWPARVLAISPDADVAVVRAENILGDVPVTGALNLRPDTLAAGAPVAMLGFPGGGAEDDRGEAEGRFARPVLSAGTLRAYRPGTLEVEGYGTAGASGSPILDARGEVVAVLFGGRVDEDGHTVFGVPAAVAARLLASLR